MMSVVYRFICLLNDIPFKVDVSLGQREAHLAAEGLPPRRHNFIHSDHAKPGSDNQFCILNGQEDGVRTCELKFIDSRCVPYRSEIMVYP